MSCTIGRKKIRTIFASSMFPKDSTYMSAMIVVAFPSSNKKYKKKKLNLRAFFFFLFSEVSEETPNETKKPTEDNKTMK